MARWFLTEGVLPAGLIFLALAGTPPPVQAAMPCAGAAPGGPAPLQADAESSPLYTLLKAKLGAPGACVSKAADDNTLLLLAFPGGGSFTVSANETIESSSQEAVLPAGAVNHAEAVRALRSVEQSAAPPKGCGIAWPKLTASPAATGDAVAEGKSCNCRVHLQTKSGGVVALGFSIAC